MTSTERGTLATQALEDIRDRPSSPIIHPAVQQFEDDSEMLLGTHQDEGGFTAEERALAGDGQKKDKRERSTSEESQGSEEQAPKRSRNE